MTELVTELIGLLRENFCARRYERMAMWANIGREHRDECAKRQANDILNVRHGFGCICDRSRIRLPPIADHQKLITASQGTERDLRINGGFFRRLNHLRKVHIVNIELVSRRVHLRSTTRAVAQDELEVAAARIKQRFNVLRVAAGLVTR